MTYFDAHKLDVGSRVVVLAEPVPRTAGATVTGLYYHAAHFYRPYRVAAKWTNAARTLVRVQLSGRGGKWFDPVEALAVVA